MVSSKDVAKRAGVSQSTVSRVLNNPSKVSKTNVEKVIRAMEELNYRPNSIARSLVSKKTKTIALISGPLHNPFFVETTTSIVNYAKEKGYNTTVFFEKGDNMSVYESVLKHQVDGIILSSIFMDDPIYAELEKLDIPVMMFNRKCRRGGNYVEVDNFRAGKMATEHLLKLGHERIGFIGGPLYTSTFYGRYQGYVEALKCYGYEADRTLIRDTDTSESGVRDAVLTLMGRKNNPSAIFAATDSIAIFAIDTLKELGYDIPHDVSICGMDNINIARHRSFELTTVGQKSEKNLGQLGIEHLFRMIESGGKGETPVQMTLEPVLYERKTTAAPK